MVSIIFFLLFIRPSSSGQSKQEVSVDALMQRMRNLSQKQNECSETELNDRFKTVEMQVKKQSTTIANKI